MLHIRYLSSPQGGVSAPHSPPISFSWILETSLHLWGGLSHATRPGGAGSALAFWGGGRSSRSPLHVLMKTTALGKFPKRLSHGEADGGSLAHTYRSPGLRSQGTSSSLTQALTLRCRLRAHGVFEGPNDDNTCYVFRTVWAMANNWSYYCAQRFCSLSWGHRERLQRPWTSHPSFSPLTCTNRS